MSLFRTKYDKHDHFYTHPGNQVEEIIDRVIDKNGKEDFVVVDKVYIPDAIQSHFESTDLNTILRRYMDGDATALQRRSASYFDCLGMPTTLAEAYAMAENGKRNFENLPLSVREAYNFDFGQYIFDVGSQRFNDIMSKAFGGEVPKAEKKESEVSE